MIPSYNDGGIVTAGGAQGLTHGAAIGGQLLQLRALDRSPPAIRENAVNCLMSGLPPGDSAARREIDKRMARTIEFLQGGTRHQPGVVRQTEADE